MSSTVLSLTFGDIIEYYEDKYIYLDASLKFVYIAKVLTETDTKTTESLLRRRQEKGETIEENPLFWFVRLTTEEFKGQWAILANAQKSTDLGKSFKKLNSQKINKADLIALKTEILEKRTWPELKSKIKDISL